MPTANGGHGLRSPVHSRELDGLGVVFHTLEIVNERVIVRGVRVGMLLLEVVLLLVEQLNDRVERARRIVATICTRQALATTARERLVILDLELAELVANGRLVNALELRGGLVKRLDALRMLTRRSRRIVDYLTHFLGQRLQLAMREANRVGDCRLDRLELSCHTFLLLSA